MFEKYIISSFFIIGFGVFLSIRGVQDKKDFDHFTGSISYLADTYADLPNRDFGKYRYMQIGGFPKVIELFIGKDAGDFKPDLEKIDELAVGEEVTIYYATFVKEENDGICRLVKFIDRGTEPVYIQGGWDMLLGGLVTGMGVLILIGLLILRKFKKI